MGGVVVIQNDDNSTLVQVMASGHDLIQCWPIARLYIVSSGIKELEISFRSRIKSINFVWFYYVLWWTRESIKIYLYVCYQSSEKGICMYFVWCYILPPVKKNCHAKMPLCSNKCRQTRYRDDCVKYTASTIEIIENTERTCPYNKVKILWKMKLIAY